MIKHHLILRFGIMEIGPFQRIAIVGRTTRPESKQCILDLLLFLERLPYSTVVESHTAKQLNQSKLKTCAADVLAQHADVIIVVGGDGSLLHAAHLAIDQNLPILGINRGTLGFLTDISPDQFELIHTIMQGKYTLEQRFLLQASLYDENNTLSGEIIALNDIVLMPGQIAHMLAFDLSINQQFVCHQRADGLIVTTPTGSTAYALSAGGPILHPKLDAIAIVPMLPHKLSSRPIVVDHNSQINIQMNSRSDSSPCISYDGIETITISQKTRIHIQRLPKMLKLIHPINYDYYHTLRHKLGWENR